MPDFQPYRRRPGRQRSAEATATISPRGTITFSPAALKALGHPEAVVLLVDPAERLLGFREARPGEDAAVVRTAGIVSATSVLRHLGANLSESRRHPLVMVDGVWCVDLKEPGVPVASSRRGTNPSGVRDVDGED